jgi:hypothetical protein
MCPLHNFPNGNILYNSFSSSFLNTCLSLGRHFTTSHTPYPFCFSCFEIRTPIYAQARLDCYPRIYASHVAQFLLVRMLFWGPYFENHRPSGFSVPQHAMVYFHEVII